MKFIKVITLVALNCAITFSANAATGGECLEMSAYWETNNTHEACNKALGSDVLDEKKALLLAQRGEANYWLLNWDAAIKDFEASLKINPSLNESRIQLGWAYSRIGNTKRAFNLFVEALESNPKSARAIFGVGYLSRYYMNQPEKALEAYKQAISFDPNYLLASSALANYYVEVDWQPDKALEILSGVLSKPESEVSKNQFMTGDNYVDKNFYATFVQDRLNLLRMARNYVDAEKDANWLIKRFPNSHQPYLEMAKLKAKSGTTFDESLVHAQKSLDICAKRLTRSNCIEPLSVMITTNFSLRNYDDALKYAEEMISSEMPTHLKSDGYFYRGMLRKRTKYTKEVEQDFITAIESHEFYRLKVVNELIDKGYYEGDARDDFNPRIGNAFDACMIDPECLT